MPAQLGQRVPKLEPCSIPVPGRVQDSGNQQYVESEMDWREKEMECSYTERAQVIEAGQVRVETERQVMRKHRTRRQEEESPDGNECRPSVGSLANRQFSARYHWLLRLGSPFEAPTDKPRQLGQLRGVPLGQNIDK